MSPEIIEQLKEVFTPVAMKIGEGAEFGWVVVMKQMYVQAWLGVFWAVLAVVFGIFSAIILNRTMKGKELFEANPGLVIPLFTVLALCPFAFVFGTIDAITHFINPEFYAIEFFLDLVKPTP